MNVIMSEEPIRCRKDRQNNMGSPPIPFVDPDQGVRSRSRARDRLSERPSEVKQPGGRTRFPGRISLLRSKMSQVSHENRLYALHPGSPAR